MVVELLNVNVINLSIVYNGRETVFDILCLLMLCLFFRNKHSIKSKLYQTKKKKMAVELFCVILSTCTATTTIYHYNYYSNCFVQLYL